MERGHLCGQRCAWTARLVQLCRIRDQGWRDEQTVQGSVLCSVLVVVVVVGVVGVFVGVVEGTDTRING